MTFTPLQLAVVVVGILALLLGVASGILFGSGVGAVGTVTLVLSVIGWVIVYSVTVGRSRAA